MLKFLLCFLALITSVHSSHALSEQEILSANTTPESIGLEIANELERRDAGFKDSKQWLRMELANASGQESKRAMRINTLEVLGVEDAGDKSLTVFDEPKDVKGTALLSFAKIISSDDQWLYLPALKRVKRIASDNKSGPFVGSEFAYEDLTAWEMMKYTYKYLRKEACPHAPENAKNEGLECFVVERFPRYENSGYTKQITWIDTKEFRILKVDYFDRKNSHIKTLKMSDYRIALGKHWRPYDMFMENHQSKKTTRLITEKMEFQTGLSEADFRENVLTRTR